VPPFVAWTAGFIVGFAACVPLGPVNITVIHQALHRGFLRAFLTGLGAICAETIYAGLALAGHSHLPNNPILLAAMRGAAVVVAAFLGIKNLLHKPDEQQSERIAERLDQRWHHPQAWLLGFLMTLSNLTLFLLWATLAAVLFAHGWVEPDASSRSLCLSGVFVGGLFWYSLLAEIVARAHRSIRPESINLLIRGCGAFFLALAILLAYRIFRPWG
jgi:threonine/homoserine/homoserine lactone efflux protein